MATFHLHFALPFLSVIISGIRGQTSMNLHYNPQCYTSNMITIHLRSLIEFVAIATMAQRRAAD